jgi:large subunit ribosomal protein L3
MKFILGQKIGMSKIFDEKGNVIPVTLIEAGPCIVTQLKTKEKDGYEAVQIGFLIKKKQIKKTEKGKEFKYLREFRILRPETQNLRPKDVIDVSIFKEGEIVNVSGVSKGKGFAGVVKRWGFRGRPRTRGTKHEKRTPGAIGAATPSRVIKGIKMAGRMGGERVTVKNLKVIKVDKENNIIAVKGAIPGRRGTLLEIYNS